MREEIAPAGNCSLTYTSNKARACISTHICKPATTALPAVLM